MKGHTTHTTRLTALGQSLKSIGSSHIYHASLRIGFATGEPSYFLFSCLLFFAYLGPCPWVSLRGLYRNIADMPLSSELMLMPTSPTWNGLGDQGSAVLLARESDD
ncbi:hypothetical protein GGI43DRAFT_400393 [Trichoderma evansii]